jgi:putative transcriptional regulator
MTTKSKFKSGAFSAIHASAQALQKIEAIDLTTMRQFDALCLAKPVALEPMQIKKIRGCAHVSQPIFAKYLNTSASTVQKWEAGSKQPSGMALKLLAVVQKHGLDVLAC